MLCNDDEVLTGIQINESATSGVISRIDLNEIIPKSNDEVTSREQKKESDKSLGVAIAEEIDDKKMTGRKRGRECESHCEIAFGRMENETHEIYNLDIRRWRFTFVMKEQIIAEEVSGTEGYVKRAVELLNLKYKNHGVNCIQHVEMKVY